MPKNQKIMHFERFFMEWILYVQIVCWCLKYKIVLERTIFFQFQFKEQY